MAECGKGRLGAAPVRACPVVAAFWYFYFGPVGEAD